MYEVECVKLNPSNIITMTTDRYIDCLISGELNTSFFKPIKHYKQQFIPIPWYKKLMFWTWVKKIDLVDIKFVGSDKTNETTN